MSLAVQSPASPMRLGFDLAAKGDETAVCIMEAGKEPRFLYGAEAEALIERAASRSTPGALWRECDEPDPHGSRYDCERAELAMGYLTDDELANAQFLADRTSLRLVGFQTAAKDRIRWLSRKLQEATDLLAKQGGRNGGQA